MEALQSLTYKDHALLMNKQVAFFPLGKAFEKQTKAIEDQGEKQKKALESLSFPNRKNELKKPKINFQEINRLI